jgi:hypothetical protein
MSVYPNGSVARAERALSQPLNASFITRCRCGRIWNVTMGRGESGNPGCVRCSCEAEIVSWSGTVIFNAVAVNAVPVEAD